MPAIKQYLVKKRKKINPFSIKKESVKLDLNTGEILHPHSPKIHYVEIRNKPKDIKIAGILVRELNRARQRKDHSREAEIKKLIKKLGLEQKESRAIWNNIGAKRTWTDAWEHNSVKKVINRFSSGKILDIGAGASEYFIKAGEKLPDVTAMDISHNALIHSPYQKRVVANLNEISRTKKLPFKSRTFQTVNLAYLLNYIKNPEIFLSEVARVTKKGGKIIITGNPTYFVPSQLMHIHDILRYKKHLAKIGFRVHILTPQIDNPTTKMLIATKV